MKSSVYIIQSLKNKTYYIGSAFDPKKRLAQHNWGQVKSTKNKRPYKLAFSQEFPNIDIAKKVEKKIKSWKRKDFIEKIIRDGEIEYGGP